MSIRKRRIDVESSLSIGEFLRLLDVSKETVSMVVEGESLDVGVHTPVTNETIAPAAEAKKWERFRNALGGWKGVIDLDELERDIYRDREADRNEPPVVIE